MKDVAFRLAAALLFRLGRAAERLRSAYWRSRLERSSGEVGAGLVVRRGAFFSIEAGARIQCGRDVTLAEGAAVYIGRKGRLHLGDGAFLGRGSVIVANSEVRIGSGTQVAHYTTIIDTDHRFGREGLPLAEQGEISSPIRIGAEVWIGAQAVILRGRTLGDRCVVGAGTVVTRDVPAQGVAVGNPARILPPSS